MEKEEREGEVRLAWGNSITAKAQAYAAAVTRQMSADNSPIR